MHKYFSLMKASMSEGMNLFKINTKKQSNLTKILLLFFILVCIMGVMYSYADMLYVELHKVGMEFVTLTLFVIFTSIMTIVEGVYKSSNLLFNCKDDDLLLSLPIKRSTVLSLRVIKFYLFELAFNSIFILPVIAEYAVHMHPDATFYVVSLVGLFLFPMIPILISCVIGTFIAFFSSKFRGKNIAQTVITILFLLGILACSFQLDKIISNIASNASSINDFIIKLYYPAGAYIELVLHFKILKLLEFIFIHLVLSVITIFFIGKIYFKINSSTKAVKLHKSTKQYHIKTAKPIWALVKKEFSRFASSTVFVTNAGFGLVLFIVGSVLLAIRFDSYAIKIITAFPNLTLEYIESCITVILFGFLSFSCFMTSITSSMISLEGKSFNILKSLPVTPYTIIHAKVFAAILMMIPCILVGDMILFIRFHFDWLSIILILMASILLPLLAETIGIMVNLKYPRMDAKNDTEVVKQSMSSAVSVLIGMLLTGLTIFVLYQLLKYHVENHLIIAGLTAIYAVVYAILLVVLRKIANKLFNNILV